MYWEHLIQLHPAAQVAVVIGISLFAIVFIICVIR